MKSLYWSVSALLLASSVGSRAASAPPAVEPECLTASPAANDQLLYFTSDKTGQRAVYQVAVPAAGSGKIDFSALPSPILFRGDATTAYRDPTAILHDGWFRLFFTLMKVEADGRPFSYTAWSKSRDLVKWTEPVIFTPRDQALNYGSPGNIVRQGGEWVLCLQTYPRPNGEKFGNQDARIWTMRSKDLETWSPPELLRVKGPDVPQEKMGRMIDAFLLEDKSEAGKWWCFFKQGGVSMSWSPDLRSWTYAGRTSGGENACVIVDGDDYVLFHSPGNGIGVKRSADLKQWRDEGVLTLGQKEWPWAQGRLTAGFVLDLRKDPAVGKALMFFHGSDYPEGDRRGGFDNFASLGLAWSDDLKNWTWPGKAASDGGGKGSVEVKAISKVPGDVGRVDLVGKSICVTTGAIGRVLDADLTVTENRCRIVEHTDGKSEERDLTLWCYELRGKGGGVPYVSAIWTSRPVKGFRLCSDSHGRSYLAWVDGTSVCIEDVSESRGMSDALIRYLSKSDRYTVPVTHLAGRKPFEGLDAIHSDIEIISVEENKGGQLQLVVRAPKSGERLEFAFDGEAWKRLAR